MTPAAWETEETTLHQLVNATVDPDFAGSAATALAATKHPMVAVAVVAAAFDTSRALELVAVKLRTLAA